MTIQEQNIPSTTIERVKGMGPFIVGFVFIQLFVNIANGAIGNLLVPNRLALIDPVNKATLLGIVGAVAAAAALVTMPIWGMLSDRTRRKSGRRLPWIFAGILGLAASIVALSFATEFVFIVILAFFVSAFYSMILGPISATIPDRTPVEKRGLFSGLAGIGVFVGGILGILVASVFLFDLSLGFLVVAVVALLALPFIFTMRENVAEHPLPPKVSLGETLRGFFVNPRKHPDFAWAFLARLVIVMGFQCVLSFQLYILSDYIGLGLEAANALYPALAAIATLGIVVALLPAGVISDRIGRRKIIVIIGAVVVAISCVIPLISPTVPSALLAIGLSGVGVGIYLAVDQALMTQVLPNAADAGKDLGVLNIAQGGGQVLAPVAASIVIGLAGYTGAVHLRGHPRAALGARDRARSSRCADRTCTSGDGVQYCTL